MCMRSGVTMRRRTELSHVGAATWPATSHAVLASGHGKSRDFPTLHDLVHEAVEVAKRGLLVGGRAAVPAPSLPRAWVTAPPAPVRGAAALTRVISSATRKATTAEQRLRM